MTNAQQLHKCILHSLLSWLVEQLYSDTTCEPFPSFGQYYGTQWLMCVLRPHTTLSSQHIVHTLRNEHAKLCPGHNTHHGSIAN